MGYHRKRGGQEVEEKPAQGPGSEGVRLRIDLENLNVCSSFVHNCPKLGTAQMPISWRMDNPIVVAFPVLEFYLTIKRNKRKVADLTTVPLITENNHQGVSHEYFMKNMAL